MCLHKNKIANLARDIKSARVDESNVGELLKSQGELPIGEALTEEALTGEALTEPASGRHLGRNPQTGCRASRENKVFVLKD